MGGPETALAEHPGHTELLQTAIFFLTENDLNQAAAELAKSFETV